MVQFHATPIASGTDSQEGDSVPMLWIHIRLNLEHKARQRTFFRLNLTLKRLARLRPWCPIDPRLPVKTYVWGVNIGSDATCWTDDFVVSQGNIVNATVGGEALVMAWDPTYESLNVWVNDTGAPVETVDFFGKTGDGRQLARSTDVKPGLFWHVWAEFFPTTDINRQDAA